MDEDTDLSFIRPELSMACAQVQRGTPWFGASGEPAVVESSDSAALRLNVGVLRS